MEGSKNDSADPSGLPLEDLEGLFEDTFTQLAEDSKRLMDNKGSNNTPNTPLFESNFEAKKSLIIEHDKKTSGKVKTSLRMKYEAEVQSFIKREGSLEDIRRKLGLSKRKVCQLLLVDPSAWTRWVKGASGAPPHIYRALEWYLLLQEKHPEYKSSLWLNAVSRPQLSKQEIDTIKDELIHKTHGELTKKAIFYLKEEDLKRNSLAREMKSKAESIKQLKRWVYGLIVSQLFLAALIVLLISL